MFVRKPARDRAQPWGDNALAVVEGVASFTPLRPLAAEDHDRLASLISVRPEQLDELIRRALRVAATWTNEKRHPLPEQRVLEVALSLRKAFSSALELYPTNIAGERNPFRSWNSLHETWRALWGDEASKGEKRLRAAIETLTHLTTTEGFGYKASDESTTKAIDQLINNWIDVVGKPAGKGYILPSSAPKFYAKLFSLVELRRPVTAYISVDASVDPHWPLFVEACSCEDLWRDGLGRRAKSKPAKRKRLIVQ